MTIYNDRYQVRHLSSPVPERNSISALRESGRSVAILGKAADVIPVESEIRSRSTGLKDTIGRFREIWHGRQSDVLFCSVQQVDLSGHASSLAGGVSALREVDSLLAEIISSMVNGDRLMLTADHGNDPCMNQGRHTREHLPFVLVDGSDGDGAWTDLGRMPTLGAVGALLV